MLEKYITVDELTAIARTCRSLQGLWEILTNGPTDGVSFEANDFTIDAFDANGEKLGVIAWADSGAAFYPEGQPDD